MILTLLRFRLPNKAATAFMLLIFALAFLSALSTSTWADDQAAKDSSSKTDNSYQQPLLIEPNIKRSPDVYPGFEKTNFEIAPFIGGYKFDGFNTEALQGIKIALYPYRSLFIEINYALTEIDESVRTDLGFLPLLTDTEFSYYDLSLGFNVLPAQFHLPFNTNRAINTDIYLLAGLGKLNIDTTANNEIDDNFVNLGIGLRLALIKWLCLHASVKNHIMRENLLDTSASAQNLSYTLGLGIYF